MIFPFQIIGAMVCLLSIIFNPGHLQAQEYERYKKLTDTTLTSVNLNYDKNIKVTVPIEWQQNIDRTFPLIIIFDSQNNRSHQYILNTIDYLTSNEQMPSSLIISVESTQEYRYAETLHRPSSENGKATENEQFIFNELIPLAERKFKASTFRMLIGHSRYGYFTTSLLCSRMNDLNGIISMSPFFEQKNVNLVDSTAKFQKLDLTSTKFYRFGIGNDYPGDYAKMDSALRHLNQPLLDAKGVLFREADHNATPGLTIGTALYEIFDYWSEMQSKYMSNELTELDIIHSLNNSIYQRYGCELVFSLGVLNGKGWFFYNENNFEKAIEAWEILVKTYPNFSEAHLYIMDAQIQLKQDYSNTVEVYKTSIEVSSFYSSEEKAELNQALEDMIK